MVSCDSLGRTGAAKPRRRGALPRDIDAGQSGERSWGRRRWGGLHIVFVHDFCRGLLSRIQSIEKRRAPPGKEIQLPHPLLKQFETKDTKSSNTKPLFPLKSRSPAGCTQFVLADTNQNWEISENAHSPLPPSVLPILGPELRAAKCQAEEPN